MITCHHQEYSLFEHDGEIVCSICLVDAQATELQALRVQVAALQNAMYLIVDSAREQKWPRVDGLPNWEDIGDSLDAAERMLGEVPKL